MKNTVRVALVGAAITVAGIGLAATANATPSYSVVNDPSGAAATCATVAEDFTGNAVHDGNVAMGVAKGISGYYGISRMDAVQVENAQVQKYCPQYWPNLVAVGAYYRAQDNGESV
jgi:hypothetical protein